MKKMNKKQKLLITGIAIGATAVAAGGFFAYKYISKVSEHGVEWFFKNCKGHIPLKEKVD